MGTTNTTNLNLEKPDGNEFKLREFHNDNMDILDSAFDESMRARIFRSTDLSISDATVTPMIFDSTRYDNNTHFSIGSPTRLTIKESGLYSLVANVRFATNSSGYRQIYIRLNGTTILVQTTLNPTVSNITTLNITTQNEFSISDFLELIIFQTSGGNLNVDSRAIYSPEFMLAKIG